MAEKIIDEREINAKVRQVENIEQKPPSIGGELQESRAQSDVKPSFNSNESDDCNTEIPIIVIKRDKKILIRHSIGQTNDFNWNHYKKVNEITVKSDYGVNLTLADILKQISQLKPTNTPLTYRRIPQLIQGNASNLNKTTNKYNYK